MLERFNSLTIREKNFILSNPQSFSLPTRVLINFNSNEWRKEIEQGLNKSVLNEDSKIRESLRGDIINIPNDVSNPEIADLFSRLLRKLWVAPCETKQDICDIISTFNVTHEKILIREPRLEAFERSKYMRSVVLCFLELLLYKLKAHEIMLKNNSSITTQDKVIEEYCNCQLRYLIEEFINSKDNYHTYMIIFMIYKYLGISTMENRYPSLSYIAYELHNIDQLSLVDVLRDMYNGTVNAMHIIDKIKFDNYSEFSSMIITDAKRAIEENYKKNKVSDKTINGELVIGDPVFSDSGIVVNSLLIEMEKLNVESIRNYIGADKIIDYSISEREVGYLKLKEELPICKLLTKKGKFYTLTRYGDTPYLLFKVFNNRRLFGLSFPADYEGERKLLSFDIPENLDYKLEI